MTEQELNQRCIALMQHPNVKNMMWNPRLFWHIGNQLVVKYDPEFLSKPKVDLRELEVLLSEVAGEPSQCLAVLNEQNQRGDFIVRALRSGYRPYLTPASSATH
jgi:hypothetical protein